jgi:hypothetical protein
MLSVGKVGGGIQQLCAIFELLVSFNYLKPEFFYKKIFITHLSSNNLPSI